MGSTAAICEQQTKSIDYYSQIKPKATAENLATVVIDN
jgi:hypothetical protein